MPISRIPWSKLTDLNFSSAPDSLNLQHEGMVSWRDDHWNNCEKWFLSTHWDQDKMATIFQMTFSNAFSWMKIYWFLLRFHWSLFPKCPTENIPALVQIMAWHWSGDRPLSEPMMVSLLMHICVTLPQWVNTLRQRSNVCYFADDILNCIMFNTKALISIKMSLTIVPWGPVDNMTALFQIMAWHWKGNKPIFETMIT